MNRDPLYSVALLFGIIAIIAIIAFLLGRARIASQNRALKKFLNNFAINEGSNFNELGSLIAMNLNFVEPLCVLARGYAHNGEFEKAISVLQSVLSNIPKLERKKEAFTLKVLADIYQDAGMYYRAKEAIIQLLGIESRNTQALEKLLIIREKQGEYEKALEVADVLEELDKKDDKTKQYLQDLLDKKHNKLQNTNNKYIIRQMLTDAIRDNKRADDIADKIDDKNAIDILWFNDNALDCNLSRTIKKAKQGESLDKDAPFALQVISKFGTNSDCDLVFTYNCNVCGHEDALFFGRCPKCHSIDSCFVHSEVVQKTSFESAMFT